MRKHGDQSGDTFLQRHLAQLKILTRLWEHELEGAKGGATVQIDRELAENLLDLLEVFIEDFEVRGGALKRDRERDGKVSAEGKPTVTRLN